MTHTLIIGDVHGCSQELSALLQAIQSDRTILVGDLFTKGPDPVGVWHLIQSNACESVLGNHDAYLLDVISGMREGDSDSWGCIHKLDEHAPGWRNWLDQCPLFLELDNYVIVHAGLHPSGSLKKTTRNMALSMRQWPDNNPQNPHWHEIYTGKKGVIFGHDARQGLTWIEHNEKPFLVGLDTGCVYGKKLSGFVVEEGKLIQIPAAQSYHPIG